MKLPIVGEGGSREEGLEMAIKKRDGISGKTKALKSPVTGELYIALVIPKKDARWKLGDKVIAAAVRGWGKV